MSSSNTASRQSGRPSALWAVTSYFNPVGYRRRLENYRCFRQRLQCPLIAVELSFGGSFELQAGDAEILIQLREGDVMWQKERLLNIGIQAAPASAAVIAWVDCDVLFSREDWPRLTLAALERCQLVHLCRKRINVARDCFEPDGSAVTVEQTAQSSIVDWLDGGAASEALADASAPVRIGRTLGLAWAARRELVVERGLYDAAILGTGDRLILNAAIGRLDYGEKAIAMNAAQRAHYRVWAEPFRQAVNGSVGFVDQTAYHLWHGDLERRGYAERHLGLAPFQFDPAVDITPSSDGCWRWNSSKPGMHEYVRRYFFSRHEDG